MIEVNVTRIMKRPYQVLQSKVNLAGHNRLTPKAAHGALEVAFGNGGDGVVWWPEGGYGYRVYGSSARKIKSQE